MLGAVLGGLALAGCSDDDEQRAPPQRTVAQFLTAYSTGDWATACELISDAGLDNLSDIVVNLLPPGREAPPECEADLRLLSKEVGAGRGRRLAARFSPSQVDISPDGLSATVVTRDGDWDLEATTNDWELLSFEPLA